MGETELEEKVTALTGRHSVHTVSYFDSPSLRNPCREVVHKDKGRTKS